MKHILRRLFRENFSYSAKERKGMLVLAGILFCLLGVRISLPLLFPPEPIHVEQKQYEQFVQRIEEKKQSPSQKSTKEKRHYFPFDPNAIDSISILELGFSPKQASAWLNYRQAGAHFHRKEDLKKLFIVDDTRYLDLEPWIRIKHSSRNESSSYDTTQKAEYNQPISKISINSADSLALVHIRGIGPYTAQKVLRYRSWLGGYVDTSQFREIRNIREAQIAVLKQSTFIDSSYLEKIEINSADEARLQSHPYIRFKAAILVAYRKQHGPYQSPEDLLNSRALQPEIIRKLLPYLLFEDNN
ncbi:MAG: hypothetical protein GC180_09940 [Bacteroidetes bacterium]|nr:hypothetical protein [Bacteroidota bacterium]